MNHEQKVNLTAQARISEISLRWTMFQLFFAIHSGALALVLIQFEPKTDIRIYVVVCSIGFWLALLWIWATWRAQKLIEGWNQKMALLEKTQEEEQQNDKSIMVFVTMEGKVPSAQGVPIHVVLLFLAGTYVAIWLIALFYFIIQWLMVT